MDHILPTGSIVTLNIMKPGAENTKFIIIRRFIQNAVKEKEYFEYELMLYPSGTKDKKGVLVNHEQISNIVFRGYSDEEEEDYIKRVDKLLLQNSAKKTEIL